MVTQVSAGAHRRLDGEGARPVNLRTDLAPLADLIELVFAPSMDDNGRAAIREMRYLSKMGPGLNVLNRLNQMTLGLSLGHVWIADGRLVGNVSIYPANWPNEVGQAWIIANVGVHPDYQRRGIARYLMQESLALVRAKGGEQAILQVDVENYGAIRLYEKLGFHKERAFTTWHRRAITPPPRQDTTPHLFITRRRPAEWRAEMDLARRVRPAERGGIGWLRPLHVSFFRKGLGQQLADWLTMSGLERLIVRGDAPNTLRAALWIERGMGLTSTRLTLLAEDHELPLAGAALLHNALRRFRATPLTAEHPTDDASAAALLRDNGFREKRSVWHMALSLV